MGRKADQPFDPAGIQSLQQFSTLGAVLLRNGRRIAQAQEAERAKSEFMSIAVHELRAPLTVTGGYLAMALEGGFGELTEPLKGVLQTAQRKTEEAKALADELLTVARLEGRALKPSADRFLVTDVVQEALVRARPRAELSRGILKADITDDIEVRADRTRSGQILD